MNITTPRSRSQAYVAFVLLACPDFPDQQTWHFQIFATKSEVVQLKHRDSCLVCPDSRNQDLPFPDFRDQKTQTRFSFPDCKYVVETILWTNIKQEAKIDTIAINFLAKKQRNI